MGSIFSGGKDNSVLQHPGTDFNSLAQNHGPSFDQSQFRDQQLGFGKMLMDQANGGGPNLAGAQLQQATDQNLSQQMALANSQRGMTPGQAMRLAAQNSGQIQQQAAQQAGIMRMQQQLQAQGLLGQSLAQGRAGDQAAQDSNNQFASNMYALGVQQDKNRGALEEEQDKRQGDFFGNLIGNAGKGIAAAATMFSDERLKEDIKDGSEKVSSFLDAINAHDYKYKDPSMPGTREGRVVSPMAQELEKSEIGRTMVIETPKGKAVDYGRGFGAIVAAQSDLHKRLKKLEGKDNG